MAAAPAGEDRLFTLRPSAWLNRLEYAWLALMLLAVVIGFDGWIALLMAVLILLLALRWRVSGRLLLPHRISAQVRLADHPPRLICYACRFEDGAAEWPLEQLRLHRGRHFLVIRHRGSALLLVADSFASAAEHARFRRRLFELMETHAR